MIPTDVTNALRREGIADVSRALTTAEVAELVGVSFLSAYKMLHHEYFQDRVGRTGGAPSERWWAVPKRAA